MPKQLERAKIIQVKPAGSSVEVLFNPSEYRVSKSNQFAEVAVPGLSAPILQYSRGNSQTLTMKLFFDTYDPRHAEGRYGKDQDVTLYTRRVTDMMKINSELHAPPICQFSWGNFNFVGVIQQADVQFTLFLPSGVPVRATVDVTFKQYYDGKGETGLLQSANYTKHYIVQAGDTLAGIAADKYEDPAKWRAIAQENNIDDPLELYPGQLLVIPAIE
jgi:nucleoid-associated protein YgaU